MPTGGGYTSTLSNLQIEFTSVEMFDYASFYTELRSANEKKRERDRRKREKSKRLELPKAKQVI